MSVPAEPIGAGPGWELFPHDADIGVRGRGATLAEAFANAARAMTAAIVDPAAVALREAVAIACEAPDPEVLLVDWLNALVFEMATRAMLFGDFRVRIEGTRLAAEALGEPIDPARHAPAVEVKGATFTALKVARGADGIWVAQCVIDV
jgi:SHS2 domain-containing protein